MSVDRPDVIDGIGVEAAGEKVVMLISDHLPWDDSAHYQILAAKIEGYVSVVVSGQLARSHPPSAGKSPIIRLVHQYAPDETAIVFLRSVGSQLQFVGIDFEHTSLPSGY
jgi:hypothetical protein